MLLLLLSLTSLALLASAFNPADRDCGNRLCLTSFIWCDGNDCYYPPNVYPYEATDYQGPPAIVKWAPTDPYNITWKNHNTQHPVRIRWSFPNSTVVGSIVPYEWEVNTTVPSPSFYEWTPYLVDFPNATNITAAMAGGLAAGPLNIIGIDQPEAALASSQYDGNETIYTNTANLGLSDQSQQFIMLNSWAIQFATNYAQRVRDGYNHRIKLGVGVGVGLGVPFLIALTTVVCWLCFRRRRSNVAGSKTST